LAYGVDGGIVLCAQPGITAAAHRPLDLHAAPRTALPLQEIH